MSSFPGYYLSAPPEHPSPSFKIIAHQWRAPIAVNQKDEMNQPLRDELVFMEEEDLRVRAELAADGSRFDGYHPLMEEVHRRNAARLREIIDAHGWPGDHLAGENGAKAAWLIAQHAIGEPSFQRRCLELLQAAAEAGDVPA